MKRYSSDFLDITESLRRNVPFIQVNCSDVIVVFQKWKKVFRTKTWPICEKPGISDFCDYRSFPHTNIGERINVYIYMYIYKRCTYSYILTTQPI